MERPRLPVKILILVALVVEIIFGILLIPNLKDTPPLAPYGADLKAGVGHTNATRGLHTNGSAGYSFSAPARWWVADKDAVSEAKSRDEHALVAFAPVPHTGSASASATQLVDVLRRSYEEFKVINRTKTRLSRHSAILIQGKGVNTGHVPVRLFAAEVTSGKRSLGVVGYWSPDASSAQRKSVRRTVRSLRA